METTLFQFIESLKKSGLLSSDEVESFLSEAVFKPSPGGEGGRGPGEGKGFHAVAGEKTRTSPHPRPLSPRRGEFSNSFSDFTPPPHEAQPPQQAQPTAREFAQRLLQAEKLTPYQATAIYQGKLGNLFLGNYEILNRIGQGGMGAVFKARHRVMKRVVAVKVLPRKLLTDRGAVKRFRREIRAAAKLDHPNIVAAFDADEADGTHFLVMEYVDGSDLDQYVKQNGPLSIRDAIDCSVQAARGLEHAHGTGIIHRDVKPSNLLIDTAGTVKVLDMGLVRATSSEVTDDSLAQSSITMTGSVMGTVDFMAPEQGMDSKLVDGRADVYSLGYTLYYLLTGQKPFGGDSPMQKLMAHHREPIPSLRDRRPDVPQRLEAMYRKMVAKDPNERHPSMTAVIDALHLLETEPRTDDAPALSVAPAKDDALEDFQRFLDGLDVESTPTVILPSNEDLAAPSETGTATTKPVQKFGRWFEGHPLRVIAPLLLMLVPLLIWMPSGGGWSPPEGADGQVKAKTFPEGDVPKRAARRTVPTKDGAPQESGDYALSFDGQDDYVEIPTLELDPSKPLTIECWFANRGADDAVKQRAVLSNSYWKHAGGLSISLWPSSDTILFYVKDDDEKHAAKAGLVDRNWHHAALVWGGTKLSGYLDGERVESKQQREDHTAILEGFHSTLIGAEPDGATRRNHWQGLIDEVRISRTARYTEDFTPPKRFETDKNTLALYHFDEVQGAKLTDSSGNNHHGTIHGATWVRLQDGRQQSE